MLGTIGHLSSHQRGRELLWLRGHTSMSFKHTGTNRPCALGSGYRTHGSFCRSAARSCPSCEDTHINPAMSTLRVQYFYKRAMILAQQTLSVSQASHRSSAHKNIASWSCTQCKLELRAMQPIKLRSALCHLFLTEAEHVRGRWPHLWIAWWKAVPVETWTAWHYDPGQFWPFQGLLCEVGLLSGPWWLWAHFLVASSDPRTLNYHFLSYLPSYQAIF